MQHSRPDFHAADGVEPVQVMPPKVARAARRPRAATRVCLIGSSYVGAVYRAYTKSRKSKSLEFSFFASPLNKLDEMDFVGNVITHAKVSSGGSPDVANYDLFVIFADLPIPHTLAFSEGRLSRGPYSAQLRAVALRDVILRTQSFKLLARLRAVTDKPIYLMSRNVPLIIPKNQSREAWEKGGLLFEQLLAPNFYIPPAPELFTEDLAPKPEYYLGSLNVEGVEPDREKQPDHHLDHLNQAGGAVVLAHIERYLEKSALHSRKRLS